MQKIENLPKSALRNPVTPSRLVKLKTQAESRQNEEEEVVSPKATPPAGAVDSEQLET